MAGCGGSSDTPATPVATVTVTATSTPTTATSGSPSTTAASAGSATPSGAPDAPSAGSGSGPVTGDVESPGSAARLAGLSPDGAVAGLRFEDGNGDNVVVLRQIPNDAGGQELFADHALVGGRVMREVRDGVDECPLDLTADFVSGSLDVHDDDEDGVGEVTFTYQLACRGDVSPAEQKLLVLEDGEKFILRGRTSIPGAGPADPAPEPAASRWPPAVYTRALDAFRDLSAEF